MATTYENLIAAGAPELPGGLFYRVKFDKDTNIRVELRQPNRYYGSSLLAARTVHPISHRPALERVVVACRAAAGAVRVGMDVHASLGDYKKGSK